MNVVVHSQSVLLSPRVCIGFISKFGFWVSVFASLGSSIRRAFYGQFCPYFSPEVMIQLTRWVRGRFVMLILESACM